jgi:hypothetical protein
MGSFVVDDSVVGQAQVGFVTEFLFDFLLKPVEQSFVNS